MLAKGFRCRKRPVLGWHIATAGWVVLACASPGWAQAPTWGGYQQNAQHTGISPNASAGLSYIRWQTPVDEQPVYSGDALLIHYGSPIITQANTVIVPVKTGSAGGFKIEGIDGASGTIKWQSTTDYILPPHDWVPSYSPTLTPSNRVYYAGAGGTVYFRENVNSNSPTPAGQIAFFGNANYAANSAAYNNNVFINTPITSDSSGNIYFGYQVTGATPLAGLQSGIARIDAAGNATYTTVANMVVGDPSMTKIVHNNAPAISTDGSKVYVAVNNGTGTTFGTQGYLVALNSTTLANVNQVALYDPRSGGVNRANLPDQGTASPTIGPDGHVYMGVLESPFTSSKGWMLHFDGNLNAAGAPGAFGWDDTASIVPRTMVPTYNGTSPYLLLCKYNNYAGLGGDGLNKLAILDPNGTQIDPRTGATVMKEVLSIAGVTPDPEYIATHPNAVREWCINAAAVDPATHSVLVNSEDGKIYRWDLFTNTFTEVLTLTGGIGEAYTPTLIGPDGSVYAINNAMLFSLFGPTPEPTWILAFSSLGVLVVGKRWTKRKSNA